MPSSAIPNTYILAIIILTQPSKQHDDLRVSYFHWLIIMYTINSSTKNLKELKSIILFKNSKNRLLNNSIIEKNSTYTSNSNLYRHLIDPSIQHWSFLTSLSYALLKLYNSRLPFVINSKLYTFYSAHGTPEYL